MTSYRCASCGSPNVMTDTQAGGVSYDYKKGIIGTVVLGPGGAVAGVGSKTHTVYKCTDCGMCLTYSMPDDLRLAIDLGVDNAFMRDQIQLTNNSHLSWNRLKQLYKNIESGAGDAQIERETIRHHNHLLSYATASQETFDNAVDILVDYENRMENNPEVLTLAEYYVWQDALYTFIENAAKYISKTPPVKYRNLNLGRQNKNRPNHQAPRLLRYFFTYFVIKAYEEYEKPLTSTDLRNYADYEPFILWFENWFFPHYFVPFGESEGSIVPWELNDFLWITHYGVHDGPQFLISKSFTPEINGIQFSTHYLPPYVVKNGILGHWLYTHEKRLDFKKLEEDYFAYNSEKKTEYDKKLSEFNASYKDYSASIKQYESRIKVCEDKLKSFENRIAQNNDSIEVKRSQIVALGKKIFGKKAARAEAGQLEQRIQIILQENEKLHIERKKYVQEVSDTKQMVSNLKNEEKQNEPVKKDFYEKLLEEMDYFIFWRWDSGKRKDIISDVHNYLSDNEDATLNDIAVQFTDGDISKAIRIIGELREKGLLDQ